MRYVLGFALVALLLPCATTAAAAEEFVGPFASWKNVRTDYGAVGDGKADDTAAIQRGLDDLVKHRDACVLYIPAGTYRITQSLKTERHAHTDCQGVSLVGEDPATTILKWDGEPGGTLLHWDAWYSRVSRLTLDGAGRADALLVYGPAFSTNNETSDLYFQDAKTGLLFGSSHSAGQAENEVLRCRFLRCETGLQTVNWNSMDIWVWYCRFEDCGRAVHNVMGNWHVWQSVFLRSKLSDLSIANLMAFSVVNNTSVGSKCFLDFNSGHTWGSPTSVTGNRILNPTGDWAMVLGNAGPYLVVDNTFRLSDQGRAIKMTWGDQTLVGNVYSKPDAVAERGRFIRAAEKVVAPEQIPPDIPALPEAPKSAHRKVIEVAAGADSPAIQRAIDDAAKLTGDRPIVHLPMGTYKLKQTLTIPSASDLQLVGDGSGETATRIEWAGGAGGLAVEVKGPSHATVRDIYIHAPNGRALLVDGVDQPGGRIFADQLDASGPTGKPKADARTAAVRISGMRNSNVLFRALQGSGNNGTWVDVVGSGNAAHDNQVGIFTGATGSAAGQYAVSNGGELVVRGVYHERSSDSLRGLYLTGSGTLSIDATRFSYATSSTTPTVQANDFHGLFTLATCMLMPVQTKETCRFELTGDGTDCSVLALNDQFWVELPGTTSATVWKNVAKPPARGGLIGCNVNTSNKAAAPKGFEFLPNIADNPDPAKSPLGSGPLTNAGTVDEPTLLRHLAPLRTAKVWLPDETAQAGATDLRFYRIMATGGTGATVEFRGN